MLEPSISIVPESEGRAAGVELGAGFGVVALVESGVGAVGGLAPGAADEQLARITLDRIKINIGNTNHFLFTLVSKLFAPCLIFATSFFNIWHSSTNGLAPCPA